ncbi:MAG: DUF4157 domain-containing protein [Enhygromyxa sp.]
MLLKKSKQPHRPRSRSPGPFVTPTRKLAGVGHAAPAGSDPSITGRKLVVGEINVPAERQADAIADRVMRTSPLEPVGATPPHALSSAPTGDSAATSSSFLSHALNQQPSPGAPLPNTARAFLEPRLATDLGHVRTHTDAHATRLTQASNNARAFAVGNDIFSRLVNLTRVPKQACDC